MLTSTASPTPLFAHSFLQQLAPQTLLVDLSIHRDVALLDAQRLGLELWDVDRLEARARQHAVARRDQVADGRALVDEALERYRIKQTERSLAQALQGWRRGNVAQLEQALAALQPKLAQAGADAPALSSVVERWARTLLATWLHGPTHGLKRVAHFHGQEAVQAFVDGARLPGTDGTDQADPASPSNTVARPPGPAAAKPGALP